MIILFSYSDVDQYQIRNNGFSHAQHVEMRLGFLEFILQNSAFTLSTDLYAMLCLFVCLFVCLLVFCLVSFTFRCS
jgi:hypothetical protein